MRPPDISHAQVQLDYSTASAMTMNEELAGMRGEIASRAAPPQRIAGNMYSGYWQSKYMLRDPYANTPSRPAEPV